MHNSFSQRCKLRFFDFDFAEISIFCHRNFRKLKSFGEIKKNYLIKIRYQKFSLPCFMNPFMIKWRSWVILLSFYSSFHNVCNTVAKKNPHHETQTRMHYIKCTTQCLINYTKYVLQIRYWHQQLKVHGGSLFCLFLFYVAHTAATVFRKFRQNFDFSISIVPRISIFVFSVEVSGEFEIRRKCRNFVWFLNNFGEIYISGFSQKKQTSEIHDDFADAFCISNPLHLGPPIEKNCPHVWMGDRLLRHFTRLYKQFGGLERA